MELMFIGADHEVTGSCHYLRVGEKNILVDYGMEQGVNVFENCELPVDPALIDHVFLTHAHIDHSGLCRCCMPGDSGAASMPRWRPAICAASCFVTALISRCRRLSGRTARHSEARERS